MLKMKFRILLFVLILVILPASAGCFFGGDGGGVSGLDELIDFGDDEAEVEAAPVAAASAPGPEAGLEIQPAFLLEVRYLIQYQVNVEALHQANRDLLALVEYGSPAEVDLEWVKDVHLVTEETEALLRRLLRFQPPTADPQARQEYAEFETGLIDAISVIGIGSNRTLNAAVALGPSGRTLLNMSVEERANFETLVREARFYLGQADQMLTVLEGMASERMAATEIGG